MVTTENTQILTPERFALVEAGVRKRRRRFLLVSIPALAVLAAALGVSFAGNSGTSTVIVGGGSTSFVFPVAPATAGIPAAITTLRYTPAAGITSTASSTEAFTAAVNLVTPAWIPAAGSAGEVTTAGDLALIDATTANLGTATALTVDMFVTNLTGLQQAYSSWAFPVRVYRCAELTLCNAATVDIWSDVTATITGLPTTYVANTDGFLQFRLPVGFYYDIVFDTGGSFYTIATTGLGVELGPTFFFTAQPI